MTPYLDPEEARALLGPSEPAGGGSRGGRARSPGAVEPRDFARPMRLSPRELAGIEARVRKALPEVAAGLTRALRERHALRLVEATEVSSEGLLEVLREPLAALRFEVAGQPGWLVWDLAPALEAVELALGARDPDATQERALTGIERNLLLRLVRPLLDAVGGNLGLELGRHTVARIREDLGTWRDGGERDDPRRVLLHFELEGPSGCSVLRLYLPGVDPRRGAAERVAAALPAHLGQVKVELAARLGASDVPLAELLALEPGDVIPLATRAGAPLHIYAEGRLRARGVLGSRNGHLAVRIVQVGPEEEDA